MSDVSELALLIMRIGFLLLLWFFIFAIVYALRSDLFGAPVRKLKTEAPGPGVMRISSPGAGGANGAGIRQTAEQTPVAAAPITPSGGALPSAGGAGGDAAGSTTGPALGPARTLVITSGRAAGTSIPLDDDFVTIGRSPDSTLVIVDEYTSTYHARLARQGREWILTDLDSTNGTRLAGEKITQSVRVPTNTPVAIGQTTFELRP